MEVSNVVEAFPEETFLPVNVLSWEDDIIFDPEVAREQVLFGFVEGKYE